MRYEPHFYQTYVKEFILSHKEAAIFLDCGLGKTVVTLTALEELLHDFFEIGKVLVIAPLRVARDTWPSEIAKWEHTKNIRASVVMGTAKERTAALLKHAEVYIINRENVKWLIEESNMPMDFDMIVIDELSSFKSYQAKRFRALMKLRPSVKRIVGLTGTPSANGLMDLWAEFRILDMGKRLGRFISHYRDAYFLPDKRNQQMVFSYKLREGAEDAIYRRIEDITVSMRAIEYLKMPALISNIVPVALDARERKLYDDMKRDMVIAVENEEIDAVSAAALSNKLLQMANGAVYADGRKVIRLHDRKLDALEDLAESANGKSVLIVYWYKHDLERIQSRLSVREIRSSEDIEAWNAGEILLGVIHPASAGHGLNLQFGGSTLVWFGLTWSLELYQQTNARLYRQGQKDTVVIHHIVAAGTMDEKVMEALEHKDKTQAALIDAVKAEVKSR
ncbi:DEAD/DEAH box helicase [Selenomonas sputigena]|uniref:DEAD/DEAH box helicase n=1 Tax=Selenomonas sputigena TaxID=69823 RepID=UPI002234D054|nr:DEAD/DEAH box helicase [Selenomonas sputigena]UZE46059.1 DEAD/DEAH box helicase [Selenomonas sputigena]